MRYKYKLNELDCAGCALEIEKKLSADKNISFASVNFSKLLVTVETDSNDAKRLVSNIVRQVEPNIIILDLNETAQNKNKLKFHVTRLILGIIFGVLGMFVFKGILSKIFIILSYICFLFRTFTNSIKLLFKSKTINENLLVTVSCVGAYLTNNIYEGLMVIILYEIGKILEELAVNNSRKSISALMDIKPSYANLMKDDEIVTILPENVNIGDIIVIKKGEKVPLDGIVLKGSSLLDTSALTGESKLRKVDVNDNVLSGSINHGELIEVKVTSKYEDSTVSRILELTENASDRKAKTETFVSKAARIYTPVILVLALLIAITLPLFNISIKDSIYRALIFLAVSCPCAIAISVPLGYFSGIGKASKLGILIKGSDFLESLSYVNKIVFDKTGTITTGIANSYDLVILNKKYTKDEIVRYLVSIESLSTHPTAKSVLNVFDKKIKKYNVTNFKEYSGRGISGKINDKKIKVGSPTFIKVDKDDSYIYLSIDDKVSAKISLTDSIKKDSKEAILKLSKNGIKTYMFTGDNKDSALDIYNKVGLDEVKYEMLPEDKYNELNSIIKENNMKTAFVGDGINDAPSLALADVGISMGCLGSQSAIEASDVVIMNDSLTKIPLAIEISKLTKKIIKQNLIFAIGVKVFVLLLSVFGIACMWQAVFADTGVTLLTILNTTRIIRK